MEKLRRTVFHERHVALGADMAPFGGWEMPIKYPQGIVGEHLTTRKGAGLFDVSHMGRFVIGGKGALSFLQHVLTGNAEALDIHTTGAQYTLLATETGGAVDDAYLYRFSVTEYLLVVNAANREKDLWHLKGFPPEFQNVDFSDATEKIAMLSLQGPESRNILESLKTGGELPEPRRNCVSTFSISRVEVMAARTGYTGEPLCFELFVPRENALDLWDQLVAQGASPVGLGARDTLRLEAGLPLYGHELGMDPDGGEIPILACAPAKTAVSFSSAKGDFVGRAALLKQFEALGKILNQDYTDISHLPRRVQPVSLTQRGIARPGTEIYQGEKPVGVITSGTMVPYWIIQGEGLETELTDAHGLRSIALGYVNSDLIAEDTVTLNIRGKSVEGVIVPFHLRSDAPPFARPILYGREPATGIESEDQTTKKVHHLLSDTILNTRWRQRDCINLIPSEMTLSPMVRMLSVMDPAFRYGEHKSAKAFYDADIFYYQGTDFIARIEQLLEAEMRAYLACSEVESRVISGQMANMAVFSGLMDHRNRIDRKHEPARIPRVMSHHIGRGGHLSSQPMGALRDFVAHDPRTEKPAVINFPVMADDPYRLDIPATLKWIEASKPNLIILGKSMVIYREPIADIAEFLKDQGLKNTLLMVDMAHVLGILGPHFQEPFKEGAHILTGSTHKTFFGTQRGIIGASFSPDQPEYELWEAIERRAFPGSVSNHHLGTLLGLLMAAYEMNHFKDRYQPKVLNNAKALARALADRGLSPAGDPRKGFTQTHQVILPVGYGRGPGMAARLEKNNIICNYQATPDEEGFTASGALRLGVSEMTRFGMAEVDFQELAQLIRDVIIDDADVKGRVTELRKRFQALNFCFSKAEFEDQMASLHRLLD